MRKIIIIILTLMIVGCSPQVRETTNSTANNKKAREQDTMNKIKINPSIDKVNEKNESELLVAVHNNDIEVAINLIDQGANVNLQDNISDSPYLYAGAQGRTEILEHMLKYADIDFSVVNRYGGNTLIPAAEKGHIDNVKLLVVDDRIDIDFQNNFGYTALIEAVALTDGSEKFVEIVNILVDAGADITLKDKSGKTALDYAREKGYEKMIEILK